MLIPRSPIFGVLSGRTQPYVPYPVIVARKKCKDAAEVKSPSVRHVAIGAEAAARASAPFANVSVDMHRRELYEHFAREIAESRHHCNERNYEKHSDHADMVHAEEAREKGHYK